MNRIESSVEMFLDGRACSQAILVAYSQREGLDPKHAMKLAAAFEGGMHMAKTCGAVTGAFMALAINVCEDDCDAIEGREKINQLVREFAARFRKKNGSLECKDLLRCDISANEGLETAIKQNLFKTRCVEMVRDSAELLEEMLAENKPPNAPEA